MWIEEKPKFKSWRGSCLNFRLTQGSVWKEKKQAEIQKEHIKALCTVECVYSLTSADGFSVLPARVCVSMKALFQFMKEAFLFFYSYLTWISWMFTFCIFCKDIQSETCIILVISWKKKSILYLKLRTSCPDPVHPYLVVVMSCYWSVWFSGQLDYCWSSVTCFKQ